MRTGAETVIFWGAGATASLGFATTAEQARKVLALVGEGGKDTLARCLHVVHEAGWADALRDLLSVLGDAEMTEHVVGDVALEAMRRNWACPAEHALRARILELREIYDWPALKEVVRICPGFGQAQKISLTELFNIIDLHAQSFHGFHTGSVFLPPHRLVAARRALQLILNTLQFIEWHQSRRDNFCDLRKHLDFARALTEHHQHRGLELVASGVHMDTRDFYLGDIAFVSLNYDPVALWAQFVANVEANNRQPPHVDMPRVPLKIFHDFGIFMAASTIGVEPGRERLWYPMNEASAQRLNDRDHVTGRRVRISKFLMPHGCLCWRECPSCGKLSAFMGKEWSIDSAGLLPPPPLRRFAELAGIPDVLKPEPEEIAAWKEGKVDARMCVHCGVLTEAHHTQNILQSNLKQNLPSFMEEVQRDMRVVTQSAEHIVLLGYSLPADDVLYRAFFAARTARSKSGNPVRCSVVVGTAHGDQWYGNEAIDRLLPDMQENESSRTTLKAAREIFGKDNVRFYGGGFPAVILENSQVSGQAIDRMVRWN